MVEAAEAVAGAFDLLDAEVEAFGGAVAGAGVVVGQDLGSPRLEGGAEGVDLVDLVGAAAGDRLVQEGGGGGGVVGEVEVPDGFLGQPGAEDLVVWV